MCDIHGRIIADVADGFQAHVAPRDGPLVVLFEHQGADQACDGGFVGEDADRVGAPLDLLVEPFQRIGGMDLEPVRLWERLVGEHVVLGALHQLGEPGMAWPEGFDRLETDEENIAETSFPAYRRVRTTITVPINKAHTQVWQVFTIDPQDLEDALSRDLSGVKEGKGEYFD